MFIQNTNDFCKKTLNLVRRISVPKAHSLLGLHPILSVVCGTDEGDLVIDKLRSLKEGVGEKDTLLSIVRYCVHSSIYPHDKTVWAFNAPQNEMLALEGYLNGQSFELEDTIKLHSNTYPFIEVEEHYTDPIICRQKPIDSKVIEVGSRPHEKKDLPLRNNESVHRTTPTLLVPTLALGSLYILSKLADEP